MSTAMDMKASSAERERAHHAAFIANFVRQNSARLAEHSYDAARDFERDFHYIVAMTVRVAQEPILRHLTALVAVMPSPFVVVKEKPDAT